MPAAQLTFNDSLFISQGRQYLIEYFMKKYYQPGLIKGVARSNFIRWGMKCFSQDDLEDIQHDVVLNMFNTQGRKGLKKDVFDAYHSGGCTFDYYICRIVHNICNNLSKRHINHSKKDLSQCLKTVDDNVYDSFESSFDAGLDKARISDFRKHLETLDSLKPMKVSYTTILDYQMQGVKNKEIAAKEGISVSRVQQLFSDIDTASKSFVKPTLSYMGVGLAKPYASRKLIAS